MLPLDPGEDLGAPFTLWVRWVGQIRRFSWIGGPLSPTRPKVFMPEPIQDAWLGSETGGCFRADLFCGGPRIRRDISTDGLSLAIPSVGLLDLKLNLPHADFGLCCRKS